MRPRKRICILATNESSESRLRFLLDVHLFAVFASTQTDEIAAKLRSGVHEALLVEFPGTFDVAALNLPYSLPIVGFGKPPLPHELIVNHIVIEGPAFAARLIEAVKLATARKRGPRPISVKESESQVAVA
jgi:hypothetical protein